ncbi:MAG TPA: molybdopterin cofactor-binding domain-containing protein, partial [Actinomycetes bacterium]
DKAARIAAWLAASTGRPATLAEVAAAAADPARLAPGLAPGLAAEVRFELPGPVFPFGAYAAVVEVDRDTGRLQVRRLVGVDDAGRVVNPLLAEGQVMGSAAQGIGQALFEQAVHDDAGQLVTGNLAVYGLPSAVEVPPVQSELLETPSPFTPLGVKGLGESGAIAVPAVIANAVADALAPLGVRHLDPPYTPERLWRVLRGR